MIPVKNIFEPLRLGLRGSYYYNYNIGLKDSLCSAFSLTTLLYIQFLILTHITCFFFKTTKPKFHEYGICAERVRNAALFLCRGGKWI